MTIIGISGEYGSGKTTLAGQFIKDGYEECSFASPIKQIAKIFGFSDESLYTTQEAKLAIHPQWGVSSREFLQKFGTEVREQIEKIIPLKIQRSLWIDMFVNQYDKNKNYVISDVRFLKEAQVIKELGGIIVRTKRDIPRDAKISSHASETEIKDISADVEVDNNVLSVEEAKKKVVEFLGK